MNRKISEYPDTLCARPFELVLTELLFFREFHKEIHLFISAKRLNTLAQDLLYHPQGHRETLHLFVNEIKEASQVQLIDKGEAEVVIVIIEDLSPEVRNCLVFTHRLRHFGRLDCLYEHFNTMFTNNQSASYGPKLRAQTEIVYTTSRCHLFSFWANGTKEFAKSQLTTRQLLLSTVSKENGPQGKYQSGSLKLS